MDTKRGSDEAMRGGNGDGLLSRLSLRPSSQVEDWSGEAPARGWKQYGNTAALLCALALTAAVLGALADRSGAISSIAKPTTVTAAAWPAGD
jgi:hypothetical protein